MHGGAGAVGGSSQVDSGGERVAELRKIANSKRQIADTTGSFSLKSMQNADFRFLLHFAWEGLEGHCRMQIVMGQIAICMLNSPLPGHLTNDST